MCGLVGCDPSHESPSETIERALKVDFAGCAAVLKGPVCLLAQTSRSRLRLWTAARSEAFALRVDGRSAPVTSRVGERGTQIGFEVSKLARHVELRFERGGRASVFRLRLAANHPDASIERARKLRARGEFDAARAALKRALNAGDPAERGRAWGWMGRVSLSEGAAHRASEELGRSLPALRRAGRVSEAVDNTIALAFVERERWRFEESRETLDAIEPLLGDYPEGRVLVNYHRGLIAKDRGDLRGALRWLERARRGATRLEMRYDRRNIDQVRGWALQQLGRSEDAASQFAQLETELGAGSDACEQADLATNLGWIRLLQRAHRLPWQASNQRRENRPERDPRPVFMRALAAYRKGCARVDRQQCVLTNLALAELQRNDISQAKKWLAEARAISDQPRGDIRAWMLHAEGQIALAERRTRDALRVYDRFWARSEAAFAPEFAWQAAMGRGRTLEVMGRTREALESYRMAERQVDEAQLRIPLGEGRGTFLGQWEESARRLVDLLVLQGRADEALSVVRRVRARGLFGLAQRSRLSELAGSRKERWEKALRAYRERRKKLSADAAQAWQLPADELRARQKTITAQKKEVRGLLDRMLLVLGSGTEPLKPSTSDFVAPGAMGRGEALLTYFPGRAGWIGFVADKKGVRAARLGPWLGTLDKSGLSERLLGPFAREVARAEVIRVLPYGPFREVDVHALVVDGQPLQARVPVAYGLDISVPAPPSATRKALVISDARGDLALARKEGRVASRALPRMGFEVVELAGGDATREPVLDALRSARWFHYAGHGLFEGRGAWDSRLLLANAGELMVGDVLLLARVPRTVVLSGCETARSAQDGPVQGLGIAHAFLLAGSETVLAATRPVSDALAYALAEAIYPRDRSTTTGASASRATAPPQADWRRFVDAVRALRERFPKQDWASYRVFVP